MIVSLSAARIEKVSHHSLHVKMLEQVQVNEHASARQNCIVVGKDKIVERKATNVFLELVRRRQKALLDTNNIA